MNPQSTPNSPAPQEQPRPNGLEQAGAGTPAPEQLAGPEITPAAPTGEPVAAPGNAAHLTADDVAQAIAAMPGPAPVRPGSGTPGMPAQASDEDVIEVEWVNQTEAAIQKTAGDPYAQEEAIEALQVDYLEKRYGHHVKKPGQES